MKAAVVLGASGSVGNALGVELRETLTPEMHPAPLEAATAEAIRSLEGDIVGLSVLGIGAGTAKLTLDLRGCATKCANTAGTLSAPAVLAPLSRIMTVKSLTSPP